MSIHQPNNMHHGATQWKLKAKTYHTTRESSLSAVLSKLVYSYWLWIIIDHRVL